MLEAFTLCKGALSPTFPPVYYLVVDAHLGHSCPVVLLRSLDHHWNPTILDL